MIIRREMRILLLTVIGTTIYGLGVVLFLRPANLYTGGIVGVSRLIEDYIPSETNFLGTIVFLINVPLLLFAWFGLSRKFTIYTIISVVVQSLVLSYPYSNDLLGGDTITSSIMGGILIGIGLGITLRSGSSTGGTDIIFQYLSLKTGKTIGSYQLILNGVIIFAAGYLNDWDVAIYTIISIILTALVLDKIHTIYNFLNIEIITESGDEVAQALIDGMNHGVTMISAKGAFTKKDKSLLYTVVSSFELYKVLSIVKSVDKNAFISTSHVKKVYGAFYKKVIE